MDWIDTQLGYQPPPPPPPGARSHAGGSEGPPSTGLPSPYLWARRAQISSSLGLKGPASVAAGRSPAVTSQTDPEGQCGSMACRLCHLCTIRLHHNVVKNDSKTWCLWSRITFLDCILMSFSTYLFNKVDLMFGTKPANIFQHSSFSK